MNTAEDLNANQPTPYTGRVAPPTEVRADNDAGIRPLPADVLRAREEARRAKLARVKELAARTAPAPVPQSVFDKLAEARKARAKAEILKASNPKKNRQAIKDHEAAAKRAEMEAKRLQGEAADDDWAYRADGETTELAKARGETVEKTKQGLTRIMTRAGIQQAYEAGYMTPPDGKRLTAAHLHETARRYRDAYEIVAGRTTPNGRDGSGGGKGPQVRLIEAAQELATMRIGLTRLELSVLDRVCGQEMRARETATVLQLGFDKVRDALSGGLTTATESLRAARAVKDTEARLSTRVRLTDAHDQIRAAERSVA